MRKYSKDLSSTHIKKVSTICFQRENCFVFWYISRRHPKLCLWFSIPTSHWLINEPNMPSWNTLCLKILKNCLFVMSVPSSYLKFKDSKSTNTDQMIICIYNFIIFQYPLWRPPAQWSKTLGFSHTSDFNLFSLGEVHLLCRCKIFASSLLWYFIFPNSLL